MKMNTRFCFMVVAVFMLSLAVREQDNRPNIVSIMADDRGCSDIGLYLAYTSPHWPLNA